MKDLKAGDRAGKALSSVPLYSKKKKNAISRL